MSMYQLDASKSLTAFGVDFRRPLDGESVASRQPALMLSLEKAHMKYGLPAAVCRCSGTVTSPPMMVALA